jgi:hypothetical protein
MFYRDIFLCGSFAGLDRDLLRFHLLWYRSAMETTSTFVSEQKSVESESRIAGELRATNQESGMAVLTNVRSTDKECARLARVFKGIGHQILNGRRTIVLSCKPLINRDSAALLEVPRLALASACQSGG